MRSFLIATTLIHSVCSYAVGETVSVAKAPDYKFEVPPKVAELLDFNCYECHDSGTKKGGIQLDNLAELGQQARLDLLNNALEQVYSGEIRLPISQRTCKENTLLLTCSSLYVEKRAVFEHIRFLHTRAR
jgi:hypothetical protein